MTLATAPFLSELPVELFDAAAAALRCGSNCVKLGRRYSGHSVLNCDQHGDHALDCLRFLHESSKGQQIVQKYMVTGQTGTVVLALRNHLIDEYRRGGAFTAHPKRWAKTAKGRLVVLDEVDCALFCALVATVRNGNPLTAITTSSRAVNSTRKWTDTYNGLHIGWENGTRVPTNTLWGIPYNEECRVCGDSSVSLDAALYLLDSALRVAALPDLREPVPTSLIKALASMTPEQAQQRLNALLDRAATYTPDRALALNNMRELAGIEGAPKPETLMPDEARWIKNLALDVRREARSADPKSVEALVLRLVGRSTPPARWSCLDQPSPDPAERETRLCELLTHLANQLSRVRTTTGA